ncbi:MAG: PepSY domain-containing protein, partial [Gammaproteobacteria bacterium]
MTRRLWALMHRYVGLAMTVFLILVGLTGSVLAFNHELDRWLNPELLSVPVREAPMLDPIE